MRCNKRKTELEKTTNGNESCHCILRKCVVGYQGCNLGDKMHWSADMKQDSDHTVSHDVNSIVPMCINVQCLLHIKNINSQQIRKSAASNEQHETLERK